MKSYLTVSALAATAALVCVSAQAQTSPLTRAQVSAELQQARASGELEATASEGFGLPVAVERRVTPVSDAPLQAPQAQGGVTREQVRAELQRARAAGEMDFAAAEVYGTSPYQPRSVPVPVYARKNGSSSGPR